jgi:protein-S-isoprenylcysteine O-methyltransferase Ste14
MKRLGRIFPALLFVIPPLVLDKWLGWPVLGSTTLRAIAGAVLIALGVTFLLWTIKAQRQIGRGTPMPLMATQKLVIQKPYSYCRNPLALGLLSFYLGISIVIGSPASLVMVVIAAGVSRRLVSERVPPSFTSIERSSSSDMLFSSARDSSSRASAGSTRVEER